MAVNVEEGAQTPERPEEEGNAPDLLRVFQEQGIGAAARMSGVSFFQIAALALKEIGKKTFGADLGLLFFLGANLQILLMLSGTPREKLPMEIWELLLILCIDILLFLAIITLAGLLSGMVSYVKEHPADAIFNLFFGPLDAIKSLLP